MDKSGASLSAAARVALQNQVIKLTKDLRTTGNKIDRRLMYAMLRANCADLGLDAPALDELGSDAPDLPEILTEFWQAVRVVEHRDIKVNHSLDPDRIALSMPEIRGHFRSVGIVMAIDKPLKEALRQCEAPRYVADNWAVRSQITGQVKKCWVFMRDGLA